MIDDWDDEALAEVAGCGDTKKEAMGYVEDGLLSKDDLRADNGTYEKAFLTVKLAKAGLEDCYKAKTDILRKAIMKTANLDQESYDNLREGNGICEYISCEDKTAGRSMREFTPMPKFALEHKLIRDMYIAWGQHSCDIYQVGDLLPCCISINSMVSVWIEELEMVEG